MNNNNTSNTSSGYRPIAPMIPISPHHSPQVHPNPQHGISLPPFGTPPVSPFSHPNTEYLPPPIQPLPPMMSIASIATPPSPTNGRYERILPKQGPTTSVFSIPMTPSNANNVMQHHNSVIHPYHQHRVSLSGAASGTNGDKPLTTADQRELARKVSHSAIERRRRERINDKIMQLKELIPSCADQDHLHKLNILQSAIEYIQYLQGCVVESRKREGNNSNNSEERFTKRSKFDRYEIPIPKNINNNLSDKSSSDSEDSNTSKKETIDASNNIEIDTKKSEKKECVNHEEANALLLLSKSTSITSNANNNKKRITETRDVEIQTSDENKKEDEDKKVEEKKEREEKEEKEETPRRGMTVQQLLCN
jgi:hypothetical protein